MDLDIVQKELLKGNHKESDLVRYLRAEVAIIKHANKDKNVSRDGYAYASMADFVLTHGRPYEVQELPKQYRRMLLGHCYANATELARRHGLIYVEGYALAFFPTLHAWCVEPGSDKVIDPTWEQGTGSAYFGVPFDWKYRDKVWKERSHECTCLLDDWYAHWPLLKEGATGWQLDETLALARFNKKQKKAKKQ